MSKRDTGGPAFPPHPNAEHPGMTLRDYFAAKAMQQVLRENWEWQREQERQGSRSPQHWSDEELASYSYEIADAMLKARQE